MSTPENGRTWRLEQVERRVGQLENASVTSKIAVIEERVHALSIDVAKMDERLSANTKALIVAALSTMSSAVIFGATIFTVFR